MGDVSEAKEVFTAVSYTHLMKDRRIKVVYGTNLAMLIETLMERNIGMSWEEILEGIIENGRKQVDFFNEEDLEGCEEENDEDWQ